uniref:Cytochrome P450 n=1 Tax=Kalanchoe fedtschenkoi TaxID=63787 RepID=A0A7N0TCL8_KALFE
MHLGQISLAMFVVTVAALFGEYIRVYVLPLRGKRLPPGSMGLPFIGETVSFLRAQKEDETNEWVQCRVAKHGPIFKTRVMGSNAVVLTGQSGNKFMFNGGDNGIASNLVFPSAKILGFKSIFEITGSRHAIVRGAIMSFLRPETIQNYVGQMDSIIKQQMLQELKGKDTTKIVPLMKRIAFNVTCRLLFRVGSEEVDEMFEDFTTALRGTWQLPLELPGTAFRAAVLARDRLHKRFCRVLQERRKQMAEGTLSSNEHDVILSLLELRDEDDKQFPDDEITDNIITLMIASHDTSTITLTHFIRHISRDPEAFNLVLKEHMDIIKARTGTDGNLTWKDTQQMRLTWRATQEIMRITPPIFGNFKTATKDTSFGGYDIPKGWKLLWVASLTHMNKEIFEDPKKFDPSRFESGTKAYPPYTYIPFGAGPRICPGAEFARVEILLLVHHLITNYGWAEADPNEPITRDPLPYPAFGLPVKLFPRKLV